MGNVVWIREWLHRQSMRRLKAYIHRNGANIAPLGNYLASTFVTSSDGHGGTNVVEHAASTDQTAILAQPQH